MALPPCVALPPFIQHFAALPDPPVRRPRRQRRLEMLVFAFCAVIRGAEGGQDRERFGRAKEKWFRERLGLTLPGARPSEDAFRPVSSPSIPLRLEPVFAPGSPPASENSGRSERP